MKRYTWAPTKKRSHPKIPDAIKNEVKQKADTLIDRVLKPKYIEPPPKDNDFNYLVDIFSKWYRTYFYFCAKYNCPSPNAMSPSFTNNFARLEYLERDKFNLAYMRHTNQWFEIGFDWSLEQCLDEIENMPHFIP
ncbi:MAG: hypothetical protein LJE96_03830 [Deltaproteobacteria bacterium]|nr:hypothetical protein [Deltaproteobacteria bacterium]